MAAIARKHDAKLVHRPIRVIQANGGIPLRTRPDSRQQYHEVELDRWRKYLDIPLNLKPKFCRLTLVVAHLAFLSSMPRSLSMISGQPLTVKLFNHFDTLLAQVTNLNNWVDPCRTIETAAQATIALQKAGYDVSGFSFAVQRALWAEDRDIADLATLKEIATASLGPEAAGLVLEPQNPDIVADWDENLAEAERRGIFGTPTYVVDDELFWGQDRLDFVDRALASAKARRQVKEN